MEKIGLRVEGRNTFDVALGNGAIIRGRGVCPEVVLNLGVIEVKEKIFPLALGSTDVILGIDWLEKLSNITTNWKLQTMQFRWNGGKVVLRGEPALGRTMVSLKAMIKLIEVRNIVGIE